MKKYSLLIISVLLLISCSNKKQQSSLPIIDVTKSYPKKEIVLQDIADVEYIPLETRDDVLLSMWAKVNYLSKDMIIASNRKKGDIFIFNGVGKIIHTFNHRGQGGEDYLSISDLIFNPYTNEIFVYTNDIVGYRLMVYDMKGNFHREVHIKNDLCLRTLVNFDENRILAYESPNITSDKHNKVIFKDFHKVAKVRNTTPMFLISKKTGSVDTLKGFKVPERKQEVLLSFENGVFSGLETFFSNNITKVADGFILDNIFCDTLYHLNRDRELKPIVKRYPPFQSSEAKPWILRVKAISNRFLLAILQEYSLEKGRYKKICFDRTNNQIVEYDLRNKDITSKNARVVPYTRLYRTDYLKDLLEAGKLKGKLKTIVEKMNDDDNPVIIKVTLK